MDELNKGSFKLIRRYNKKTDEDIAINSMNKPEVVNSMVGSVVKKEDEDNVIDNMNEPEIVDSMVEIVVKK